MSIIDQMMESKKDHVNYLKDLFAEMTAAGFTDIRIADEDLEPLDVEKDGPEAVIREMFQLDGGVQLNAAYPQGGKRLAFGMLFILCNDAWESLADFSYPSEEVYEKLQAITGKIEDRYL